MKEVLVTSAGSYSVHSMRFGKVELLRVVADTHWMDRKITASLRLCVSRTGLIDMIKEVESVRTEKPAIPMELRERAEFALTMGTCDDPLLISSYRAALNVAARDGFSRASCNEYKRYLRQQRSRYPASRQVAGRYGWGYCYSCGAERPGRFRGRMCPSCTFKKPAGLAYLVSEGMEVCSDVAPVVYPGVVNTSTRHPPLKSGVMTTATEKCVSVRFSRSKVNELKRALELQPVERVGPRLGGVGIDGAIPFVSSVGVRPLAEAVCYRIFKQIAREVEAGSFEACTVLSEILLRSEAGSFLEQGEPMTIHEWLRSLKVASRRKILTQVAKEMLDRGHTHHDVGYIQAFVKSELLPYFGQGPLGPDYTSVRYVARLIQAPHDETHVIAGPYLKPLVDRLKKIWNHDNWLFYASVCPKKLDQWLARVRHATSWYWSDYSAFDATYSPEAWKMLEGFYKIIYPEAAIEFHRVLDIWRQPRGKCKVRADDAVLEYEADVCNASGRDDTGLANALLNGLVLGCSFAAALAGKPVSELHYQDVLRVQSLVDIAIVGDDSLVACAFDVMPYMSAIEVNIKSFGLIVKANGSHWIGDVTFLGMMPYSVGGSLHWGPTIGRRIFKAFWQREPIGNLPAWTRGVAKQLMLYRNVPILYDLAVQVDKLLSAHAVTPLSGQCEEEAKWSMSPLYSSYSVWSMIEEEQPQYTQETLEWVCARYAKAGLTLECIHHDLGVIKTISRLPAMVRLQTATACLEMDEL
jgi:hypothetical protein